MPAEPRPSPTSGSRFGPHWWGTTGAAFPSLSLSSGCCHARFNPSPMPPVQSSVHCISRRLRKVDALFLSLLPRTEGEQDGDQQAARGIRRCARAAVAAGPSAGGGRIPPHRGNGSGRVTAPRAICLERGGADAARVSSAKEKGPLGGPGCLCGRGLGFVELGFDGHFLNCLYGRERRSCCVTCLGCFLSCLCGSEPDGIGARVASAFLSCLCGSEHRRRRNGRGAFFLSCLLGSAEIVPFHTRTGAVLRQGASDSKHLAKHYQE